jgi:transposase-like protein
MKTYKKKYYKKKRTLKKRGGAGAAADERFKCPFCDKTFSAMSNIYIHCKNKHNDQPMPRLTHASTVVRGADAVVPRPSAARWRAREQFVAANGPERFKCPFCDKTYTEITNIYGHCRRKHPGIQMIRLTYDNTIVRPVAAAPSGPPPAAAADRRMHDASRLARRIMDSDDSDSDDDLAPPAAAAAAPSGPALGDLDLRSRFEFRNSWARGHFGSPPPLPPAAAAAVVAPAPVAPGQIVSRTGTLQGNSHYITNPIPNFPTSGNILDQRSTYVDWLDMEEKNVLDALNEIPDNLAFKLEDSFCVITKGELFTLMNNPDSIKYECNRVCEFSKDGLSGISASAMKSVPYFSIGAFSMFQGLVSFSDLWHIVVSQQSQLPQAYELVDAHRPHMASIASHNFLFGSGAAGARAVSAAHCQAGQDASDLYEIRILPIASRSRSRAATTIQRLVRGHRSRRNPR